MTNKGLDSIKMSVGTDKTQQIIDYRLEIKVTVIAHRASGNVI